MRGALDPPHIATPYDDGGRDARGCTRILATTDWLLIWRLNILLSSQGGFDKPWQTLETVQITCMMNSLSIQCDAESSTVGE